MRFSVATHNTARGTADPGDFADIVVRQELWSWRSRRRLRKADGDERRTWWPRPHFGTAITFRDDWTRTGGGSWRAHRGLVHVTPARGPIMARLENGAEVAVFGVHYINGARHNRHKFPGSLEYRERHWDRFHATLMEQVERARRDPGTYIVIAGDFNADDHLMPDLPGFKRVGHRIDWILYDDRLDLAGFDRLGTHGSDHPVLRATFRTPDETPEAPMPGLCPFARHRLIPPGAKDPAIRPRVAILHVDAGNAESLHDYFRYRSGGIESHFHVTRAGVIEQYRSIYVQADANHRANDFAVSIETQGYGAGVWTPEQLASIKRLLTWLHDEADIPLVKCPRWDGSGVGYHVQFGAPGHWTPVAKSCPGPDRIRQYHDDIVPWMNGTAPRPAHNEEDDMAWDHEFEQWGPDKNPDGPMPMDRQLQQARGYAADAWRRTRRIERAIEALAKALGPTVEKAVTDALAEAVVDVEVTVTDRTDQEA